MSIAVSFACFQLLGEYRSFANEGASERHHVRNSLREGLMIYCNECRPERDCVRL
jgi:hypothetical protein